MKQLFLTTLIFFTLTFNAVFALDANIKDGAISYSENIKTDLSQDQITGKLEQYISNNFKGASENHKLNEETPVFSCNQWGKIDLYKSKLSSSSIYIKYRVTLKWENNECRVIFSNIQYIEEDNINEAGEIKRSDEAMSGEFVLVEKKYKSLLKKNINQIMIEKTEEYFENFANGIKEDLTK